MLGAHAVLTMITCADHLFHPFDGFRYCPSSGSWTSDELPYVEGGRYDRTRCVPQYQASLRSNTAQIMSIGIPARIL